MTYLQHKNGIDHRFSYITHHYVKQMHIDVRSLFLDLFLITESMR